MNRRYIALILFPFVAVVIAAFQNASSLPDPRIEIREGSVATPMTSLYCKPEVVDLEFLNCQIPFAQYRARDSRVLAIEKNNHQLIGSNLVGNGRVYKVSSAFEFNRLSGTLSPGDEIVLNDNKWINQVLKFHGQGTKSAPIIIRSETRHGASFRGHSQISISGRHIIIYGLEFKNVIASSRINSLIQIGITSSPNTTCESCILTHSRIHDFNYPASEFNTSIANYLTQYQTFQSRKTSEPVPPRGHQFVRVYGKDITISNSDFSFHTGLGRMIQASYLLPDGSPSRLHLTRNFFGDRPYIVRPEWPVSLKNGYEILMLGGSSFRGAPTFALIENNLIQRADGEIEIFTIKASDVIIRHNTFRDSLGALTLRKADRVLVEGNYFIGGNRGSTHARFGGIRVIGGGHWIVNNFFINVGNDSRAEAFAAVSIMSAGVENIKDALGDYHRVKNVLLSNNTFFGCSLCVVIGTGYDDKIQPLLPMRVGIVANAFSNAADRAISFSRDLAIDSPKLPEMLSTIVFSRNLFSGQSRSGLEGFPDKAVLSKEIFESTPLVVAHGRAELHSTSRGVDLGVKLGSFKRLFDIDGLYLTNSTPDIGADEKDNDAGSPKKPWYFSTLRSDQ